MKLINILFIFVLSALLQIETFAHTPEGMKLEYDSQSHILTVTVYHEVYDNYKHYIGHVDIKVSGKERLVYYFQMQDNKEQFKKDFSVFAGPGSSIEVKAYCNKKGSVKNTLQITGEKSVYKIEEDAEYGYKTRYPFGYPYGYYYITPPYYHKHKRNQKDTGNYHIRDRYKEHNGELPEKIGPAVTK